MGRVAAVAVIAWLATVPAWAQQTNPAPVEARRVPQRLVEFPPQEFLDFRDNLKTEGVEFTLGYGATFMGNPVGGLARGVAYAGLLNVGLSFDLETLIGIPGNLVYVSGSWGTGESLSQNKIGNAFDVSNVFQGVTLQLYEMYISQKLLDDVLDFRIGRLSTGNDFAVSPLYDVFVSFGFNANPISLALNDIAFWVAPDAAWAARLYWEPGGGFYTRVGAYNGSPRDIGRTSSHGADFAFHPENGSLLIAESGYELSDPGEDQPRGDYRIGGYYDTAALATVADSSVKEHGMYNLYALVDQELYREDSDGARGLRGFATFTAAPRQDLNLFPFFTSGGLVYTGLFPSRPEDQSGFAVAYGMYSRDASDIYEMTFELTHIFSVTSWLQVQPDLQVVVHPGIDTALVLGGALSMAF